MLTAKLFAGLAGVIALLAFLARGGQQPAMDIYLHDTYYVISHSLSLFALALICAILAGVAFAAERWTSRTLNTSLGVASFALIAAGFGIFIVADILMPSPRDLQTMYKHVWVFSGAMLAFLIGCILFAVNVAWTLVRLLGMHLRGR